MIEKAQVMRDQRVWEMRWRKPAKQEAAVQQHGFDGLQPLLREPAPLLLRPQKFQIDTLSAVQIHQKVSLITGVAAA
ncbi:hypothetical protein D3C71_1655400 [compost metagenome]